MYLTQDRVNEPLYVLTPRFDPWRYKTPGKLYDRFQKRMRDAGAVLVSIEAALGERDFAIDHVAPNGTPCNAPVLEHTMGEATCRHDDPTRGLHRYLSIRTNNVFWMKENMLEIARRHLPKDAKYFAWIDHDWEFARTNWVGETIQLLQHYDFIQMFSHYVDLGPNNEAITLPKASFASCYLRGLEPPPADPSYYAPSGPRRGKQIEAWTPGGAWAARMDAAEWVGGIMDFNIVGGGDNHMAFALIGQIERFFFPGMTGGYRRRLLEWQRRAQKLTHCSPRSLLGCMEGLGLHYFHGKKRQRGYSNRWRILADNHFNPDSDLSRDANGLYQLMDRGEPRNVRMRDQLRHYFRSRNEDSIDI